MTWFFIFVVNSLAVHRITKLIIDDRITESLRNKIFDRFGQPHESYTYILTCPWCISIWVALIAVLFILLIPSVWFYVALVFALSSVVGLIEDRK